MSSPEAASSLFEIAALVGLLWTVAGPLLFLLLDRPFFAGTAGYLGIAVFAGGIAARHGFIEHHSKPIMLLRNIAAASVVSGAFYLVFLVVYLL